MIEEISVVLSHQVDLADDVEKLTLPQRAWGSAVRSACARASGALVSRDSRTRLNRVLRSRPPNLPSGIFDCTAGVVCLPAE